mmetsp:Transcript_39374/g.76874  ORF Transcript_39374/g.76874 Transcript_39374/m.76874 type:complete len:367 (+) Transcript_39374:567-1667(+)
MGRYLGGDIRARGGISLDFDGTAEAPHVVLEGVRPHDLGQEHLDEIVRGDARRRGLILHLCVLTQLVGSATVCVLLFAGTPEGDEEGFEVVHVPRIDARAKEGVSVRVADRREHLQHPEQVSVRIVVFSREGAQLFFHTFETVFGRFEELVLAGRHRFTLEQAHHVRARPVRNREVKGCVVVVVHLLRSLGEGVVQCLYDLNGGVVVGGVVEREITVVVLAGRALRKRLEEEPFHVQWTFFPGREVEGKISVIICYRGSFRISTEECIGNLDWSAKTCGGVQRYVPPIVFDARLRHRACGGGADDGGLPSLRELVEIHIVELFWRLGGHRDGNMDTEKRRRRFGVKDESGTGAGVLIRETFSLPYS